VNEKTAAVIIGTISTAAALEKKKGL